MFWNLGGPREQFSIHEKSSLGCKVGRIRCRGIYVKVCGDGWGIWTPIISSYII